MATTGTEVQIALVSGRETTIVRRIMNIDSGSSGVGSYIVTGLAIVGIALGGSALYASFNSRSGVDQQSDRISELEQKVDRLNGAAEELQGQIRGLYNQTRSSLEGVAHKLAALEAQGQPRANPAVREESVATPVSSQSAPAASGKTYTVRAGDYPAKIAKAAGTTVPALMKANPGLNPSKLKVGQVLQLP